MELGAIGCGPNKQRLLQKFCTDHGFYFGAPVTRTGHIGSVRFFRRKRFVNECGKGRSGVMNGINLMGVILPALNNDINTVPSKFQMLSIYLTSGTEQSSEQAVTVTVDLNDTRPTMKYGVGSAEHGKCGKGWGARGRVGCRRDMYWGSHGR
jgi:hypothetical protein